MRDFCKLCRGGSGRMGLQESHEVAIARHHVLENLASNDAARVPKYARMCEHKVTGRCAVHLQIRRHAKRVLEVKSQQRSIVLAHTIRDESVHSDAENYDLRSCSL